MRMFIDTPRTGTRTGMAPRTGRRSPCSGRASCRRCSGSVGWPVAPAPRSRGSVEGPCRVGEEVSTPGSGGDSYCCVSPSVHLLVVLCSRSPAAVLWGVWACVTIPGEMSTGEPRSSWRLCQEPVERFPARIVHHALVRWVHPLVRPTCSCTSLHGLPRGMHS